MPNTHKYILAIDQGTTGTTALLVDQKLNIVSKANFEFDQIFPKPGWVEHKDTDIWESVRKSVTKCLELSELTQSQALSQIAAIGITNQRETTCLFDKAGRALHNFVVWQCKRSTEICEELKSHNLEQKFRDKTGLLLDPYFSGTKLKWLLNNNKFEQNLKNNNLLFGNIDSWLVYKLSAGQAHVTDVTNASRTLLMNLETLEYDQELLDILEIPREMLPEIKSCAEVYAHTKGLDFLPDGIPISGMAGDQQAALFGQACFESGEAKATYGTGSFILLNTGNKVVKSKKGLLTSVAYKIGSRVKPGMTGVAYCLEGSAFIAGAAVQWLRDNLGLIESAEEIEGLAEQVDSCGEVTFVPALTGLGTPYWRPDAKGVLRGISRDTNKSHIARAVLEGIAFQNVDILTAMGEKLKSIRVDGGACANNLLMQTQADLLNMPCLRPKDTETTALGAAALAGLGVGMFDSLDNLKKNFKLDREFRPNISEQERAQHLTRWHKAVECA